MTRSVTTYLQQPGYSSFGLVVLPRHPDHELGRFKRKEPANNRAQKSRAAPPKGKATDPDATAVSKLTKVGKVLAGNL